MNKLIILIIFLTIPLVNADTDGLYHSAILGNSTIYMGKIGNLNLGLFFEERLSLTEEIFQRLEWFNTDLFSPTSTGGAISHLLLLFTVIGIVTIAETTVNPALMVMAGMAMFFFGWFILLTISLIIGFFIFPFSALYMVRVPSIIRNG